MTQLNRVVIALAVVGMCGTATAEIPGFMGFQGHLVDDQNTPIDTTGKEDLVVTFELFHEAVGATSFWSATQGIAIEAGTFFTLLGDDPANPIVSKDFDGKAKYLQITIGDTVLEPRLLISSVPYAFKADTAGTATYADSAGKVGDLTADDLMKKADYIDPFTEIDALKIQLASLEGQVKECCNGGGNSSTTLNCKNECELEETGCSEDFGSTWTCGEANDGDECLEKIQTACSAPLKCVGSGKCDCKPDFGQICLQGNSYSTDSCGNVGSIKEQCDEQLCGLSGCVNWIRQTPIKLNNMNDLVTVQNNVYAVGKNGAIVNYDGTQWRDISLKTQKHLNAVWARTPSSKNQNDLQIYVVGQNGKVINYDGSDWKTIITGYFATLNDVHGSQSTKAVWAVGNNGTILNYNGFDWEAEVWEENTPWANTAFRAVWVDSPDKIWVAGDNGTMLIYDGETWTQQTTPSGTGTIHDMWGYSALSVFAVSDAGIIDISVDDENVWQNKLEQQGLKSITGIFPEGKSTPDIYIAGDNSTVFKGDGNKWSKQKKVEEGLSSPTNFRGISASDDAPKDGVWAVGDNGTFVYLTSSGKPIFPSFNGSVRGIFGVTAKPNDRWAVGENCLALRFQDGEWLKADIVGGKCDDGAGSSINFNAIWGDPQGNTIIAVGDNNLFKTWDGDNGGWTETAQVGPSEPANNNDIWSNDGSTQLLVRSNATYYFDSKIWQHTGGGAGVAGYGTGVKNFNVVTGNDGKVHHFDGSEWSVQTVTSHALKDITGTSANNMWVIGANGSVYQFENNKWTDRTIPEDILGDGNLNSVWQTNGSALYAAANTGYVYRYHLGKWSAEQTAPPTHHSVVYGVDKSTILLGGVNTVYIRK